MPFQKKGKQETLASLAPQGIKDPAFRKESDRLY